VPEVNAEPPQSSRNKQLVSALTPKASASLEKRALTREASPKKRIDRK